MAEVAADQREVAVGYQQLEALALRIADAAEAEDRARAEQIREAIGAARRLDLDDRFDRAVRLLERERYAAARRDQTELATQLEELLRLVMADPCESRFEEEKRRLEQLRKEVRAALREQRGLRARVERGEVAEAAPRQEELAERIERLQETVPESEAASEQEANAQPNEPPGEGASKPGGRESTPSLGDRLRSAERAMRDAAEKLADDDRRGADDQTEAQRELEAAQRQVEERLRQLREEEKQRKLASLADRFRRMHEEQSAILKATTKRADAAAASDATEPDRVIRLAATKLAERESSVAAAAEQALRVVRADGSSRVFDEALVQALGDIRTAEERLRAARFDTATIAVEQSVVDSLAEMLAAVDESLNELERQRAGQGSQSAGQPPDQSLVTRLAELRMIRAIQARLLRQTEAWRGALDSGESPRSEVEQRLRGLAKQQRRLAEAAEAAADAP